MRNNTLPPFKQNDWEPPAVEVTERESGELLLRSPRDPLPVASSLIESLRDTVARYPQRNFMAQRGPDGEWVHITFAETERRSSRIAQWFLEQDLAPETPVMILSENSLEHMLIMLGAMKARLPVVPVSPGYSLLSSDHLKVRKIHQLIEPGVLFVQDSDQYAKALNALELGDTPVIHVKGNNDGVRGVAFAEVEAAEAGEAVEQSCAAIRPDTVAKILFTSGSTGEPKGVINTHRNLCFTQSSLAAIVHIDREKRPPVLLDWLPWHHTYGGNQNVNRTIRYAGTLYIDDGKPVPGMFERTLRNLRELQVTTFSTVPAAYPPLLDALEVDDTLRENFFAKLEWLSYGGSDMPQHVFERIQKISIKTIGKRMPVICALGSTETTSVTTAIHWANEYMGNIGLPVPGSTVKLIPLGDKYELRVKGPQVAPAYFKDEANTRAAFDEEGFFRSGDALRWVDPEDPHKGLRFAGRVAEDFKLLNGTWVHTGGLRSAVVSALSPLVSDLVVTGQDQSFIGVMVWPNEAGIRSLLDDQRTALSTLIASERFRQYLSERVSQYNQEHNHASTRIKRLLVLAEPPSLDHNEITDKRYINQRAVLERRADQVARLYADEPDAEVIGL